MQAFVWGSEQTTSALLHVDICKPGAILIIACLGKQGSGVLDVLLWSAASCHQGSFTHLLVLLYV
jgi:hypothetical protein